MIKLFRFLSFLSLVGFLAAGSLSRAADVSDYGTPAGAITVPNGITVTEVQKCIIESAIGRGCSLRTRDEEKIVITLTQEKWSSTLTLLYSVKDVQFFSKTTKSGKPKLPEYWLKYLKQDINAKLATLAVFKQ